MGATKPSLIESDRKEGNSEKPKWGMLHRLWCAWRNKYPFGEDGIYRDGSIEDFYKSKLAEFREYRVKATSAFGRVTEIANLAGLSLTVIGLFNITRIDEIGPLFIFGLIVIILGLSSIYFFIVTVIWNDKKNYSRYYEDLISKNIDIRDRRINTLFFILEQRNLILKDSLHKIAEKFRKLYSLTEPNNFRIDAINNVLQSYLDELCRIATNLHYDHISEIGKENLDKYASCIKIVNKDQLYVQANIADLTVKTLGRSRLPGDPLYQKRLDDIGKKYDSEYEKIYKNTDFRIVLEEKRWYYYLNNFIEQVRNNEYESSHPGAFQYYQSAVTFPIVYRNESISIMLGYLCFDNHMPNAFPTCAKETESIESSKAWEEFCCSQVDLLSIFLARYFRVSWDRELNTSLAFRKVKVLE